MFRAQASNTDTTQTSEELVEDTIILANALFEGGWIGYHKNSPHNAVQNLIQSTNIIASRGPRKKNDVANFLENLVFNVATPVHTIFAFGDRVSGLDARGQSFHNYFHLGMTAREQVYENSAGGFHYKIKVLDADEEWVRKVEGQVVMPDHVVRRTLEITRAAVADPQNFTDLKRVELYFTPVHDNQSMVLDRHTQEVLYMFDQKTREPGFIAAHCASGIGRTGQALFILRLMARVEQIFANPHPADCAAEILQELADLRASRPGLVVSHGQFIGAIRHAIAMVKYCKSKPQLDVLERAETPVILQTGEDLEDVDVNAVAVTTSNLARRRHTLPSLYRTPAVMYPARAQTLLQASHGLINTSNVVVSLPFRKI